MNTDGNLYALNKHLDQLDLEDMRNDEIELRTGEVMETLLGGGFIGDVTIEDFMEDMEITDHLFAEYLKGGNLLRDELCEQFNVFCEAIAVEIVDNYQPEPDEGTM